MYLGRIVEISTNDQICNSPKRPYTQALISASPIPDPELRRDRIILEGDVPGPIEPPTGCHFPTCCPKAFDPCDKAVPALKEIGPNHLVKWFLYK